MQKYKYIAEIISMPLFDVAKQCMDSRSRILFPLQVFQPHISVNRDIYSLTNEVH